MKLTRRVFIALAGSSALMASAPSLLAQGVTVKRLPLPCTPAQGRWIGSACQGCTQYCAIEVFNQKGRATRVRGNQQYVSYSLFFSLLHRRHSPNAPVLV